MQPLPLLVPSSAPLVHFVSNLQQHPTTLPVVSQPDPNYAPLLHMGGTVLTTANRDAPSSWKLFVGQVPSVTTEEMMRPLFQLYGALIELTIMRDHEGRSKGCAWVRYETQGQALAAIEALHDKHTVPPQTNALQVRFAKPSPFKIQQQQQQPRANIALQQSPQDQQQNLFYGGGAHQHHQHQLRMAPMSQPHVIYPASSPPLTSAPYQHPSSTNPQPPTQYFSGGGGPQHQQLQQPLNFHNAPELFTTSNRSGAPQHSVFWVGAPQQQAVGPRAFQQPTSLEPWLQQQSRK